MKNKKNTIMLISVIIISLVILTWNKSYSYEMNDNIVEEKEVERKEFGIYLEKSQGSSKTDSDYTETTIFPKQGYLLNEDKTECYEYGTNTKVTNAVTQSLTKGVIDGTIIVTSNKSMYCKIYFDKDDTLPTIKAFELTGNTDGGTTLRDNKKYTHIPTVNYTLTWDDSDVAQICVKEVGNGCTDNDWKEINETSKSDLLTVSNTDGEKTINAFVKDKANNISEVQAKSITLDTTNPTITLTEDNVTENSITVNVEANDTNGISSVTCKAEGNSTIVDGEYSDTDRTCIFNDLKAETEYTITGEVEDNSGRKSTSEAIKVKTPSTWKCTEGNLVNDSSKGSSSGGYICVKDGEYNGKKTVCNRYCEGTETYLRGPYKYFTDCDEARAKDACHTGNDCTLETGEIERGYYYVARGKEQCETYNVYVCQTGWESYSSDNSKCYKLATKDN